jgi:hypothetical protein
MFLPPLQVEPPAMCWRLFCFVGLELQVWLQVPVRVVANQCMRMSESIVRVRLSPYVRA